MSVPGKRKYRRVIDLYARGVEMDLRDGSVFWLAVLNPFERDEALHDAQVARSRLSLAARDEASDDYARVRSVFVDEGRDSTIEVLLDHRRAEVYLSTIDEMRTEPEWREKTEIMERNGGLAAPTAIEQKLVDKIGLEYATELNARVESVISGDKADFESMDDEELWKQYFDWWVERRGAEIALAEYRITEVWLGTRVCNAEAGGEYDHSACDGHRERVFDSKEEVRALPESLQADIIDGFVRLDMSERDARFSARQESSSESSPLPSEPVDSESSSPTATPVVVPGPYQSP